MKIINQNKSLCFLLLISIVYIAITFLFINPLREKTNDLDEKKSEILISEQQNKYIREFSKQKDSEDKLDEDIILSIEESIGNLVSIKSINKQYEQGETSEELVLEVKISSNLRNIFKLDKKLEELNLDKCIETIEIQNNKSENSKVGKVDCTMTFRVG